MTAAVVGADGLSGLLLLHLATQRLRWSVTAAVVAGMSLRLLGLLALSRVIWEALSRFELLLALLGARQPVLQRRALLRRIHALLHGVELWGVLDRAL